MNSRSSKKTLPAKLRTSSRKQSILSEFPPDNGTRSTNQSRLGMFRLPRNKPEVNTKPEKRMQELKRFIKHQYKDIRRSGGKDFKVSEISKLSIFTKSLKQPTSNHLPSLHSESVKEAYCNGLFQNFHQSILFSTKQKHHSSFNSYNNTKTPSGSSVIDQLEVSQMTMKGYIPIRPKKENQDSYISRIINVPQKSPAIKIKNRFEVQTCQKSEKHALLGVFDGHGKYGHIISATVRDIFNQSLEVDPCNRPKITLSKHCFKREQQKEIPNS